MDGEIKLESKVVEEDSRALTSQDEVIIGSNKSLQDDEISIKMDLEPLDDDDLEYLAAAEAMEVQTHSPEDSTIVISSCDIQREHSYSKPSCDNSEEIVYDSDPELQMVIEEEALEFSKLNSGSTHVSDSDDEGDKNYRNILRNMTADDETNEQLVCKCLLCQRVWNEKESFVRHLTDKHSSVPYVYVVEIDDILKITSTTKMDKQYLNHVLLRECETTAVLYKCSKCFDLLGSYTLLNTHMQETHAEDISKYGKIDTHTCRSCLWEFISNEEYLDHGRGKKRNCSVCGVIFNSCLRMGEHLLKDACVDLLYCPCGQMGEPGFHMAEHALVCQLMPDTNDTLHCPCGFFGTWDVAVKHFKTCQKYNGNEDCYVCIICNAGFFDLGRLSIHWSVKHHHSETDAKAASSMKNFSCVLCGASFPLSDEVIPHMHQIHKKKASFPCMTCFALFETFPQLARHVIYRSTSMCKLYKGQSAEIIQLLRQIDSVGRERKWGVPVASLASAAPLEKNSNSVQTEIFSEKEESNGSSDSESRTYSKKFNTVLINATVCKFCKKYFPTRRTLQKHIDVGELEEECSGCGERMWPSGQRPKCTSEVMKTACKCPSSKSDRFSNDQSSVVIDDSDTDEDVPMVVDDPSSSRRQKDVAEDEPENATIEDGVSSSPQNHTDSSKLEEACAMCGKRKRSGPSSTDAGKATTRRCKCPVPNPKSCRPSHGTNESSADIDDSDEDSPLYIDDPSTLESRMKVSKIKTENAMTEDVVSKKSQVSDNTENNSREWLKIVTASNENEQSTSGCNTFVEIEILKPETDMYGYSSLETKKLEMCSVNANSTSFNFIRDSACDIDIKSEIKEEPKIECEVGMVLDVKIEEPAEKERTCESTGYGKRNAVFKFKFHCKGCNLGAMSLKAYLPHHRNHGLKRDQCVLCRTVCENSANSKPTLLNHLLCHVARNYQIEWRNLQKHLKNSALKPATHTCSFCDEVVRSDELYQHWEDHYLPKMKNMVVLKLTEPPDVETNMIPLSHKQVDRLRRHKKAPPKPVSKKSTLLLHLPGGTRNLQQRRVPHSTTGLEAVPLSTRDMLETLNRLVTKSKRVKNCHVCDKSFGRRSDLMRHLVEHLVEHIVASPDFNGVYTCQICQEKYAHVLQFKRHLRNHANLTIYQCEICNKAFADSSNFCKHKKVHNIIYMQCDTCGRKFTTRNMLEQHMEYHLNTAPMHCPFCERYFYFESGLKKHITYAHSKKDRPEYACPVCLHRFESMKRKWDHMWKAHHIRSVEADCPFCKDVGFRKKQDLARHVKEHHPGKFNEYRSKERWRKPNQVAEDKTDAAVEIDRSATEEWNVKKVRSGSADPNQLLQERIEVESDAANVVEKASTGARPRRPRILKKCAQTVEAVETVSTVRPPLDSAP